MKYENRRVAITGATGTIGVSLVKQCIEDDMDVIVFINPDSKNEARIPNDLHIKKVFCSLDKMEEIDVTGLKADVFVHLAWASTNRTVRNNMKPQVDNIKYSLDSVELADKLGCKIYVGVGSQAEYGKKNEIIHEETTLAPETAYGMAKLCAGQMTRAECMQRKIKHVWLRVFSTYGPYTQDSTIINYTIKTLLKKEKPTLTGCDQIWDFLYVDDAARAILLLADKGRDGEIYCVSSGQQKKMKDYIEIINKSIDSSLPIGYGELKYDKNSVMYLAGDISKIHNETGFLPETSFEEGIQRTIEWAKRYYKI